MNLTENFNPKKSLRLIEHKDNFNLLKNLVIKKRFPKVLMLSGMKGDGKFTLICHLLHYYFDKQNYSENENIIQKSAFHEQFLSDTFPNIYYLNGSDFKNVKIEDIRSLRNNLLKKPIIEKKRFIILDDVETFNINSLNGLLKLIEEPGESNYFILINNSTKNLLETIKSRCLELKIILSEKSRLNIIAFLMEIHKQKNILDKNSIKVTPGNFVKFNSFFCDQIFDLNDSFLKNFKTSLNFYKKEKDIFYKDLLIFLTEYFLQKYRFKDYDSSQNYFIKRSSILKNLNNFFLYNLSQSTLINNVENKLNE